MLSFKYLGSVVGVEIFDETKTVLMGELPEIEVVGVFVEDYRSRGRLFMPEMKILRSFRKPPCNIAKSTFRSKPIKRI